MLANCFFLHQAALSSSIILITMTLTTTTTTALPAAAAAAGVQSSRDLARISGSLGIIDDIMHYGTQNVTSSIQDSLKSDLKTDDLIFVETKPRNDFVHWDFVDDADDEIVKVGEDGNYVFEKPQIDMSDFVSLVPQEVSGIVARYYKNDMEVQKGYTYLRSKDFDELKDRIIANPEMNSFLNYLNNSGLDVVGLAYALVNVTGTPEENIVEEEEEEDKNANSTTTMPTESLNGLHGLVDSILDILPQDQILSLFFDKLETSEEFSKLVENIGSPEFEKILHKLEDSIALRNLIYILHTNGIYITKIVDSLKAYFFLGTF
ncbi:uncharacterized protein LOC129906101 [Episyrphus balteatus]|uniref:uncharacterized protein LOC129906101 n=1 Tax=Episyrphus balteatus TaxID=286459 RepID=UPI0024864A04|nr:uncharacterized protein LOC129906101 [Episyrphus balteatus]